MGNSALFLDRDGTINYDSGYIRNPVEVKLYPGVIEGIKVLKNLGMKIIVISNQSGIARGILTHADVESVNNRINEILMNSNTSIDAFYYCPYHPDFSEQIDNEESCRKPSPKMVFQAASEHDIELDQSYFMGDKLSDIECGINAGTKTIFFKNDTNEEEIISLKIGGKTPNFVACNFLEACDFIKHDIAEAGT